MGEEKAKRKYASSDVYESFQRTYVQNEDKEVGLLAFPTELLLRLLDILLELTDSVLERRPRVVDLVNDENVLADQVGHLQGAEIQPLCAGDLGTGDFLGVAATEVLVERQTDGLNGDVRITLALEERPACTIESGSPTTDPLCSVVSLERTGGFERGRSHHRRWRS